MKPALAAGGLVLGLALGFGAVRALGPLPAPTPPPVPGEPIVVRPQPSCPDESAVLRRVGELQQTLATERGALDLAQEAEEAVTGPMLEWPEDVDPSVTEAAVEAELLALVDAYGGRFAGMDCGEYPCVALVAWGPDSLSAKQSFEEALRERFPGLKYGPDSMFGPPPDIRGFARAYGFHPDEEVEESVRSRIALRTDEAALQFDVSGLLDEMAEETE